MIGEIFLGLVPIIFVISGLVFLVSDFYYFLNGKLIHGKVVATEKYLSRSGSRNKSTQLMYRDLVEFYFNGAAFRFFSGGSNYISRQIGSNVSVYSLKNSPEFVRLKKSNHLVFGLSFTIMGSLVGYFMVFKSFNHLSFLFSCLLALIALPSFYLFIKKKSKGAFSLGDLFKTRLIKDTDLEGRDIFWSSRELSVEKSKNAKAGLLVTSIFILFYSFFFKSCYDKLTEGELGLIRDFFTEFKGLDQLIEAAKGGPMIGVLFCIVLVPLLFHSVLYSLKKL